MFVSWTFLTSRVVKNLTYIIYIKLDVAFDRTAIHPWTCIKRIYTIQRTSEFSSCFIVSPTNIEFYIFPNDLKRILSYKKKNESTNLDYHYYQS